MKYSFVSLLAVATTLFCSAAEPVKVELLPAKDPANYHAGLDTNSVMKIGAKVEKNANEKNARAKSRQVMRVQKLKFNHKENSGRYKFEGAGTSFETSWSCCGQNSVYAYRDYTAKVGYKKGWGKLPDNPNRFEKMLDFSSRCYSVAEDETVVFKNADNRFLAVKIIKVNHGDDGSAPFLEVRYRIY